MKPKALLTSEIILIILSLVLLIWSLLLQNKINELHKEINTYETIVNQSKIVNDSIEYNIIHKDSIIIEIKKELQYETELVKTFTDDESVVLFNKLVWSE